MNQDNARQAGLTDERINVIYQDQIKGRMKGDGQPFHNRYARAIEKAVLAAQSADARNGEGVALTYEQAFQIGQMCGCSSSLVTAILQTAQEIAAPAPIDLAPCIGQCGNAVPASGDRICHECREAAPAGRDLKDWWHAPDGSLHYGDGEQDIPQAAIQHIPHAHKAPFDTVIAAVDSPAPAAQADAWAFVEAVAAPGHKNGAVLRESAQALLDRRQQSATPADAASEADKSDSHWFSLVMGAAASLEDAANWLNDPDSKRITAHAAEHYREKANAAMRKRQTGETL